MPQVQVIQPIQLQPKRLRVAAYARVSSDSTDQLNSLSVQVDYYTHLMQENPNWDFAGIYADEGITGTSTKHREQFNRLMDDCRAGLIDRVLVKSASRFARNTADALASVREMKNLGVTVAFEKENFDTETSNGEMILSMICATAQEESLSISQNTKWGIRKRMHDGDYVTSITPFGYKKVNRQLFPDEKEALIVKKIFSLFLAGSSTAQIASYLNANHPKPDVIWRSASVRFILRNEKYIGDSLFQKNYTPAVIPGNSPNTTLREHTPVSFPRMNLIAFRLFSREKAFHAQIAKLVFCPKKYFARYAAAFVPEKSANPSFLYGAAERTYNLPPYVH